MRFTLRQRLMASTLLFGAAVGATPAWAQAQDNQAEPPVSSEADPNAGDQDPGSSGQDEEIIVTGSRIARPDLTSTSPLAVVQDEEFALSGAVNVEQVINTLPQVIPGATAFSNNPGGGVATLNLRGLGAQRNLVLVNGRRYIFFDTSQVTDLNTIPSFLIEAVDVVTGGASAVYGSDALAGVINFRLRRDINGLIAGGQYTITEDGDGERYNAYAAIGTQFADGRGHVAVFGEYYNRGSVFQSARSFSRFAFADGATGLVPGGSANVPQGRFTAPATQFIDLNGNGTADAGETFTIAGTTGPTSIFNANTNGAIFASPGAARAYAGAPDSYNYAPSNYLMVPQKRWTLGGYGEYEVTDGINLYGEVNFINNQVVNRLAATPVTQPVNVNLLNPQICGGPNAFINATTCAALTTIAANQLAARNAAIAAGRTAPFGSVGAGTGTVPAISAGVVRLTANYRVTQIADRINTDDRNAFRVLAGSRGEITEGLNYDLYYMYSRTKNSQTQIGNISRSAFATNVANGTCNIFGLDQLSDACIDAVSIGAQNQETSTLQVASGSISGTAFTSPWATSAVGFAIGAEWRKMAADFNPDTFLSSGDVVGFNAGDPTSGSYDVKEVFGEIRLPIIQDSFISRFELTGAARYSDYSLPAVGGVWTYAAGAELAPIRDITFRAQYQRAVRAPNVGELFGGQSVGFPAATDPCALATAATNPTVRALCIATGVPAPAVGTAALQPNAQIEGVFGGNPNLQEEVGDTYTIGAVIRPSFIPRLNVAIDYYDIKIDNAIAAAGGGVAGILNLCYNVIQDAASPVCQAINRDTSGIISGGGVFVVEANNANLASLRAKGVDLQVDYTQPLNFGLLGANSRLSFFFLGSYTEENSFTPVVGVDEVVQCAGRFGLNCDDPTPRYKWSTRLSWMDGPLTTSVRWRHQNSVRDDDDDTNFIVERIDSYDLIDLAFSVTPDDRLTLNLGVNNLFDKRPPILGSNQEQANTYPGTFDVLGREYFISANVRF